MMNYIKENTKLQLNSKLGAIKFEEEARECSREVTQFNAPLLVKTEVCCRFFTEKPENTTQNVPNFVKKFLRKHTASFCMINDGTQRVENETLLKFATRLSCCNSKINDFMEPKSIDIKEQSFDNHISRHITGTIKCGSPWICPSCSATLSLTRGEQLKHMVECGREHGRGYGMAVLTVMHKPDNALLNLQDIITDIWKKAQGRTPFRKFREENKIRFIHKGYEIMASIKNGKPDWHPHFNLIFDYDFIPGMTPSQKIEYELKTAKFIWKICNGIAKKYHGIELKEPFLEEVKKEVQGKEGTFKKSRLQVKGGVSFNLDFVEEYTTKFGLVEEATAGMYKNGKGSFHPFQILDMIRKEDETMTKQEKILLIRMFREYSLATKGKSFFQFARGSLQYYQDNYSLDLKVLDDELEIQAREAQGNIFYSVELDLWRLFSPNSLHLANLLLQDTAQDMEDYILRVINFRLIDD